MTDLAKMPDNPAELAAVRAEQMTLASTDFSITAQDASGLGELDYAAGQLGFIGNKYFVEASRSLSLPVSWNKDKPVSYVNFMGLTFEAEFVSYSKVVIGRIVGAHAVRALCLVFNDAMLLPYFDQLQDDHLLYVPVLAVNSISAQAA